MIRDISVEVRVGTPEWPGDAPFVMHMIPAKGDLDFYALARRTHPAHSYYVGSTMFETAGVPAGWATAANAMDEIWVPSTFNQRTFAASGIFADKLHVLPLDEDEGLEPAREIGEGG